MNNEKKYSVDWFSNNIPMWEAVFSNVGFTGKNNLTFLEIGCFEGLSTNYILNNILTGENCKIHVVDTFAGNRSEEGFQTSRFDNYEFSEMENIFRNNTLEHRNRIVIHRGDSGKILKTEFEDEMFDFFYVDGSHTAYDVLRDAVLSHSLLKVGGVIIFDDYRWKDPNNLHPTNSPELAIQAFYHIHQFHYDIIFIGYQIGLIKTGN